MRHLVEIGSEVAGSVGFRYFCDREDGRSPLSSACHAVSEAVRFQLRHRFIERVFQPAKHERREWLDNMNNYIFWCGGQDVDDEKWAEIQKLLKEFGGDFPPRDYDPAPVAEMVGTQMGMTREQIDHAIQPLKG